MAKYRLFIASFAKFDDFETLKDVMVDKFEGKWVKKKNLHMTYKFLGEVEKVEPIIEKLEALKYDKKPKIKFKRLKLFKKKYLVLRSSNKSIYKIHSQIDELLKDEFETNPLFKPHITLMKIKKTNDKQYRDFFKTVDFEAKLDLTVCLVQSVLKPDGVKYKILRQF